MKYCLSKCKGDKKNIYEFDTSKSINFKNAEKLEIYLKEKKQEIFNGYWLDENKDIVGCLGAKPTKKEMKEVLHLH